MKIIKRLTAFLLITVIILPLSACFSDVGEPADCITDGTDLLIGSGSDTELRLSNGIVLALSSDGTYYTVTDGSACTSSVVKIPDSVNGIPVEVIYKLGENEAIEALLVPAGLTRIYSYAFNKCPNLKYTEYGNAKYLGNADNEYSALISAELNVQHVDIHPETHIIADEAFCGASEISEITFPEGLEIIGNVAFMSCGKLTRVALPDSLKAIGDSAFAYCKSLAEVDFGASLESIGANSFSHNGSLKSAELPDTVTYLGDGVFRDCTALERVVIGDGVEAVPSYAFSRCTALTDVQFGGSVRVLDSYAFAECLSLTDIKLPSTVDTVFVDTFTSCTFLNYKYYGKELRYLPGENSDYEYLVSYVYDSFEKATLHPDTRIISKQLFTSLESLKELSMDGEGRYLTVSGNCIIDKASRTLIAGINTSVIPDDGSIDAIGDYAFYCMEDLTLTALPAGIRTVGRDAFSCCTSIKSLVLNPELESLGTNAFSFCGLESVTFGDRIESIGEYAFNLNSIKELYLPSSLRELQKSAFQNCSALEKVEISDGLTELGVNVFRDCRELREVVLPSTLERIGKGAFLDCSSLTEVELPDGIGSIGEYAFSGTALTSVILPESLKGVGGSAFKTHTLVSVEINGGVSYIGRDAFVSEALSSVSFGGTAADWERLTSGIYDMFNADDTVTVSCSDGDIECLGVNNIPSSAFD